VHFIHLIEIVRIGGRIG